MFTNRELEVKTFIESKFVPAIHEMMEAGDPMQYVRYGGRCCKQIAYLLAMYLNNALPEYEWSAWESMFDESEGWEEDEELYPHAWTFGRSKTNRNHCIIMDYGKLEDEYSFFLRTNHNGYPEELEDYYGEDDPLTLDREETDYRIELKPTGLESFTQKSFEELLQDLGRQLNIEYDNVLIEG